MPQYLYKNNPTTIAVITSLNEQSDYFLEQECEYLHSHCDVDKKFDIE